MYPAIPPTLLTPEIIPLLVEFLINATLLYMCPTTPPTWLPSFDDILPQLTTFSIVKLDASSTQPIIPPESRPVIFP